MNVKTPFFLNQELTSCWEADHLLDHASDGENKCISVKCRYVLQNRGLVGRDSFFFPEVTFLLCEP